MSVGRQDVFESALARRASGRGGLVRLSWRAPGQGDRVVQVYVDGRWYDVSGDVSVREMWLWLDAERAHRIELMAVAQRDAHTDLSGDLRGWEPGFVTGGSVTLVRDGGLDVDSWVSVDVDGVSGQRRRLWDGETGRVGFGALLGEGRFGFDDATALGFAQGDFGGGAFGSDGAMWRWSRDDLGVGLRVIGVTVVDGAGRVIGKTTEVESVEVGALPRGASGLRVGDGFVIEWDAE